MTARHSKNLVAYSYLLIALNGVAILVGGSAQLAPAACTDGVGDCTPAWLEKPEADSDGCDSDCEDDGCEGVEWSEWHDATCSGTGEQTCDLESDNKTERAYSFRCVEEEGECTCERTQLGVSGNASVCDCG